MAKFKWTYHQEDSISEKNGEKLWYLDIGFDAGYEMEIQKTDDGPFTTFCYKGPRESMPKMVKKKAFKNLDDAKRFGIIWLIDGLKVNTQSLQAMIEDLAEEVLANDLREANQPKKKK